MMVSFIRERRGYQYFSQLVNDLASGRIEPSQAFTVASNLQGAELESAWSKFVSHHQAGVY